MTVNADPIRGDSSLICLMRGARNGEQQAWDALVERYSPLIWSICRSHGLDGEDANEVGRHVWLHLVEHFDEIPDLAAIPGWLATTTTRECRRALREARGPQAAGQLPDVGKIPSRQGEIGEDDLLVAERHAALREAFADLPPGCQRLIALLIADPPVSYAEISARLGMPEADIRSTRACCLDKLRSHPAIAALINARAGTAEGQTHSHAVAQ